LFFKFFINIHQLEPVYAKSIQKSWEQFILDNILALEEKFKEEITRKLKKLKFLTIEKPRKGIGKKKSMF